MEYAIDCEIYTDNAGIRNAVAQLVIDESDPRVVEGSYKFGNELEEISGIMLLHYRVAFNSESDCDNLFGAIKALSVIIGSCEKGSFVRNRFSHSSGNNTEKEIIRKN